MNNRLIIILVLVLLLSSCRYLVEHYYGFYLENDSEVDIFCIMDYDPSDNIISDGSECMWAYKHGGIMSCSKPLNNCYDKYIRDSVHLYVAFLDSLRNSDGVINLDLSEMKDNYLIARMTLSKKEIIDTTFKSPMKTIYYPPRKESIPIVYYKQ